MWIQDVPDGVVNAVTYSPDGSILYTLDSDRWYTAWDAATHKAHRLFQHPETCSNHFPRMFTSPDGRFLVSNTSPAMVWDLVKGSPHQEVPAAFSYAGVSMGVGRTRVECVSEDWLGIRTFDFTRLEKGEELRGWDVPGTIKTHHFTPDGKLVALLNWSDVVTVCDTETRKALHTIDTPKRSLQHCRFAPDGKTLVMYASDHIAIWDMPSASFRVDKVECERPYWMLAFHPTMPLVAVRGLGETHSRFKTVVEIESKEPKRPRDGLLSLVSLETGEEVRTLDFDTGKPVTCVGFSPDGLTCAVGGTNKQFAVFDVDV